MTHKTAPGTEKRGRGSTRGVAFLPAEKAIASPSAAYAQRLSTICSYSDCFPRKCAGDGAAHGCRRPLPILQKRGLLI